MSFVVLLGIAVGLSMDAFAVAVACSLALRRASPRQTFRMAFHFGLFQALMPVLGWAAGNQARTIIQAWDHWIAFGLLLLVGGKAIYEALTGEEEEMIRSDPTRGLSLVVFSVATSIDALAVGLSLAMIDVPILTPAIVIGIVTASLTTVGMVIGPRIGERLGRKMEVIGGVILIGIGLKILLSHLCE